MPSSPVIDKLTQLQEQVLETVEQVQEPVVKAARQAAEVVEPRLPELPALPFADKLPSADELVANQYDFVLKVIEQQKRFIEALIDAGRPVAAKVVVAAEAKPVKAAAKKAA